MQKLLTLCFAVLFLVAAGFAQDDEEVVRPSLPVPAKTTLRARVVYEDTGRPIRRTTVTLIGADKGKPLTGVTDSQGNLEIKNVPAGKYYPIVSAPGVV